ncbi:hypothetical protein GCM10027030_21630 [Luteococcus sediminum]|uniref:DUF3046 domain-containing protein n=1 Tax=Luteococcus sp. TaxID=1969402 RepID=UPI00373522B7
MSETELWRRMAQWLPEGTVEYWAEMVVLAELDGCTVREALAQGVPAQAIWRAVWAMLELPPSAR